MAKAVFNPKKTEDHYSSVISLASMTQTERNHYWSVNSEPIKSGIICTLHYKKNLHFKKNFLKNSDRFVQTL